jgi:monomeric isocitrate dehydrogenase
VRTDSSLLDATAETNVMTTAVMLTLRQSAKRTSCTLKAYTATHEIWNWRNFLTESLTHRPHMMASTIFANESSMRIMSDASFATSVPLKPRQHELLHPASEQSWTHAMPMAKPTLASFSAGPSLVPSPVTPTTSPMLLRV